MPDMTKWLGWNDGQQPDKWLEGADRGAGVGFMLGHRGAEVTLYRNNTALDPQVMIVAPYGQATTVQENRSEAGASARDELLIVGRLDLNIRRGDEFMYNSTRRNYKVTRVNQAFVGMVQAWAEVFDGG